METAIPIRVQHLKLLVSVIMPLAVRWYNSQEIQLKSYAISSEVV